MHMQWGGGRKHAYYGCSSAGQKRGCDEHKFIRADLLEPVVHDELVRAVGPDTPMRGKKIIPAVDHSAEIDRLTGLIDDLQAEVIAGRLAPGIFAGTRTKIEKQRAALEALPSEPERVERPLTGQTFGQHWSGLDADGRRGLMRSAEVQAYVLRSADDSPPLPDPDGRNVSVSADGWRITLYLGDLLTLRELATQS